MRISDWSSDVCSSDLCGTGIDALHFANRGYPVVATDWSPGMVARTEARIAGASPPSPVTARHLGVHQPADLDGTFDGIYSNFGPKNCVPDLGAAAEIGRAPWRERVCLYV